MKEEKINVVETEAEEVKEETDGKEKKGNIFSRAWKKTKDTVSDSVLENKIANKYRKEHTSYTNYNKDALLSSSYAGEMTDSGIIIWGEEEFKPYSVLVEDEDKPAYFVLSCEKTSVKVVLDGIEYERPATLVKIDSDVQEVNVIKAGKRYFLYKGEESKK